MQRGIPRDRRYLTPLRVGSWPLGYGAPISELSGHNMRITEYLRTPSQSITSQSMPCW